MDKKYVPLKKLSSQLAKKTAILGVGLITFSAATAQEKELDLKEVEIATARVQAKEKDLPQKVQVISAKEIQQSGVNDLTTLLKQKAGVDVVQYPGLLSGIGMRGYRPQTSGLNQRTLILVDGVPAGASNLALIDLDNVERVEVIKGASSSLYGSQAMGGIVNIIRKKSDGEIKKSASIAYGSYDALTVGFNAGGSLDKKFDFDVNIKHVQQNQNIRYGHDNIFRNKFGWDEVTRTYFDPEFNVDSTVTTSDVRADGEERAFTRFQYQTGGIRFGYQINEKWRADLSGNFFSGTNIEAPGDYAYGEFSQSVKNPYRYGTNLAIKGQINDNNQLTIKAYNSSEYSDYRSASAGTISDYVTFKSTNSWRGFQIQDNIKLDEHALAFGVDYNKANARSQSFNSVDGAEQAPWSPNYGIYSTAIFGQAFLNFMDNKLHATLGARIDNITFDVQETEFLDTYNAGTEAYSVFNPSAGLKYDISDKFNAHASAGRAFVTPHAYNVAGYSETGSGVGATVGMVNITSGNPDLKPETGITFDAGVGYFDRKSGLDLDVTYFSTNVSNRITTGQTEVLTDVELTQNGDTIASRTTYVNADKGVMGGIETNLSWDLGAYADYNYSFKLFVNAVKYTQLEEEFRITSFSSEDKFGTRSVYNVADLLLTYGVAYSNDKFNAQLSGRYMGNRFDTDWTDYINQPQIEYASYMVLDFSFGMPVKENSSISLNLNNITDENYYEKRGFNMAGRNFRVQYTHRF